MNKHPPDLPESIKEFIEDFEKAEIEYIDYMTRIYLIPEEVIWKSEKSRKRDILKLSPDSRFHTDPQ